MWVKCHVCEGFGYKDDKECLICKFYIVREVDGSGREDESLILRDKYGLLIILTHLHPLQLHDIISKFKVLNQSINYIFFIFL